MSKPAQSAAAIAESDYDRLAELVDLARANLPEIGLYLEEELKRIPRRPGKMAPSSFARSAQRRRWP